MFNLDKFSGDKILDSHDCMGSLLHTRKNKINQGKSKWLDVEMHDINRNSSQQSSNRTSRPSTSSSHRPTGTGQSTPANPQRTTYTGQPATFSPQRPTHTGQLVMSSTQRPTRNSQPAPVVRLQHFLTGNHVSVSFLASKCKHKDSAVNKKCTFSQSNCY